MVNQNNVVTWEGKEYIPSDKNTGWYVGLIIIGAGLAALSIWLKWWTFTALIVVSVVALFVYSIRPPRVLHYELSAEGLREGDRLYAFNDYRSFGVLRDGNNFAIVLIPKKRFSPAITVYFPETQGEAIVDMFGARLPMEEVRLDFLDKLTRFLRI